MNLKFISILIVAFVLVLPGCKAKKNATSGGDNNSKQDRIEEILIQASTEKILGNEEQAKEQFLKILELDKTVAIAHFELSEIYHKKRDANNAVLHAEKAYEFASDNEWYASHLASIYKQTNQLFKSEEVYKNLVEKHPNKDEYLFSLSEVYLYQGKLEESLPLYDKIEEKSGITEELTLHKNQIYLELKQPEKAIEGINKLIDANPKEARYYGLLAELYDNIGERDLALENYNKILEVDPSNGYAHLALYEFYNYHGQKEKAQEELKLSFQNARIEPINKVEILSKLFINSERNEDLKKECYDLLQIGIETHPNSSKLHAIYADFLARDYRDQETMEMLEKAIELEPSEFNLWYQYMMVLTVNDKSQKLKEKSNEAIELFPSHPTFFYFNGLANIQLKDYHTAVESLEYGKDLVFDNDGLKGEFHQYIGDAYHQIGNHSKSDYNYDEALAINPNNVYVLNNYAYYLSLRKEKLSQAAAMSKKSNDLQPNNATYLDTYGWVLYQDAKYIDAEIWLQKALDNGGSGSGEVLEHYGDALFKLGKKIEAIDYWKRAQTKPGGSEHLAEKIETESLVD